MGCMGLSAQMRFLLYPMTNTSFVKLQTLENHIVLVMELCDCDLADYIVSNPFKEEDVTLFLYQLGESQGGREGGREGIQKHQLIIYMSFIPQPMECRHCDTST